MKEKVYTDEWYSKELERIASLSPEELKIESLTPKSEIADPKTLEDLEDLRLRHNKEVVPEMMGIHAINPGTLHNHASRSVMTTQHYSQRVVPVGSEPPMVVAGPEYELGRFTFATRMPHDGQIVRIIPRYANRGGETEHIGTPEYFIIYQKEANGEYDYFTLKDWKSYHQHFGFLCKKTKLANAIREGSYFKQGDKFADTTANTEDEFYTYGVNFITAFMDVPQVAEDGMVFSRSALKRLRINVFEEREISFGTNSIPLNSYGDDNTYKIFPDIGEEIPLSGFIMAIRPILPNMSPAMMSKRALRNIDHTFDEKIYSRETSISERDFKEGNTNHISGKIVDIEVIRTPDPNRQLPPSMTKQLDKYADANRNFHKDLVNFEVSQALKRRSGTLPVSERLQILLARARGLMGGYGNRFVGNLNFQYQRTQKDEYTVRFTIQHTLEPNLGWKATDVNGGKGVIVAIWEDEDMPLDADGKRAEVIVSTNATIGRSNWGREFVPYFATSAKELQKKFIRKLGGKPPSLEYLTSIMKKEEFDDYYNELLFFYQIVSPRQYWYYKNIVVTKEDRALHLHSCLTDEIRPFMPIDNPINDIDAILHLEKHFPQAYGPVTYRGIGGEMVTTKMPVRLMYLYIMLLEKIADSGSAANIGKLQHHCLLASHTRAEKFGQNYRHNHTRNFGEAEMRLLIYYALSVEVAADLHDRCNNPETMIWLVSTLLRHPTPTNIDSIVDRTVIEYDGSRPFQYFQHFNMTQGFEVAYMNEKEAFRLGEEDTIYVA